MQINKKQKLELTWIGKDEELKLEPRVLIEDPNKSYGDPNTENMLIYGDNLLALKALEQDFTGKIKCIYIDPPYNTGSAFEYYDDHLEHSIWLSLMKPRLEILQKLLSSDGVIWISIDDNESHYLKVLCDEIFLRDNFVADIAYERSGSAGLGQGGLFVNTAERILVYKKNILNVNDILGYSDLELKTMKRYNKILVETGQRELIEEFNSKSNGEPVKIYRHTNFKIETISLRNPEERIDEINKEFVINFNKLFRTNNVQKENAFQNELINKMDKKFLYTVDYVPSRGKYQGKLTTLYYYNSELFAWLKDSALIEDNKISKANKLTNVWSHADIPKADLANEGKVDFPRSKKPEQLIKRILEISTNEQDYVLDSFLGSGTTSAVAHKLKRKWIGIELGEHANTHCLPRLRSVVDGRDATGITKNVGWSGGGGFKFYNLAPSLLRKDSFGNFVIDEKYNANMLAAAMCKQEGFKYLPDETQYWKQGKSTETDYIFVTTGFVTLEQLDSIHAQMTENESLLICAKAYAPGCENHFSNITIKKIPQMILGKCEFGKENYDLNIVKTTMEEAEDSNEAQDEQ